MPPPPPPPPLSLEAAAAQLLAPGAAFELTRASIRGRALPVFTTTPSNLAELYRQSLDNKDATFLVYEDERYTFGDTWHATLHLARALTREYGVKPGDRVAIASRNYPELCFALMATTAIGAVATPLNAWWKTAELEYALADSGARVVLADDQRLLALAPILPSRHLEVVALRRERELEGPLRDLPRVEVNTAPIDDGFLPEVAPDADALLAYTSGSTGHPKGAVSTHRAVTHALMSWDFNLAMARLVTPELFEEAPEFPLSVLCTLPLFHVTGLHSQFLMSFRLRRKLVMMRKWDVTRALELIEKERITTFSGVPTMSWELMHAPDLERFDLRSLKGIAGGGAARPPDQVRKLTERFPTSIVGIGYGLTETNAIGATNSGPNYALRPASVGRPAAPLVEMKIIDESGLPLDRGVDGEICIRSCTLFREYLNKPEETKEALDDEGWLHTGDVGHLDEEGFLFITDRAKNIVIRGGENVSMNEVENALFEHDGVYEALVFGLPDARLGETVAAVVVPKPGHVLDAETLRDHVAGRLANFKVPSRIWIQSEALTRLGSGKIDRRGVRAARLSEVEPE